jgi:hypothetical protein
MRKFVVCSNKMTLIGKSTYTVENITVFHNDIVKAFEEAQKQFSPGAKLTFFMDWGDQHGELRCNVCRGPWHPATGDYQSENMLTCGVCTRKWAKWMKTHMKRKWGKLDFYEHARSPEMK